MQTKIGLQKYNIFHNQQQIKSLNLSYFSAVLNTENNRDCKIDSRTLKMMALQTPSTVKPGTKLLARRMINALMNNRKIPRVKTVTGRVKIINSGLTKRLRTARTIATIIAVRYVSTSTPLKTLAKITTAAAVRSVLIN